MIDIVDSWYSTFNNRHFKIDVYGKRQTALKPLATFLILQLFNKSRKSFVAKLGDGKCGFLGVRAPRKAGETTQGGSKGPHRNGH
jgi:hypothetical protein